MLSVQRSVAPATGASSVSSYRDSIDLAAEREAVALDFFAEELDQPQRVDPLRIRREESDAATARGLPPVQHYRYDRTAAALAWLSILDALKVGQAPKVRPYLPDTREDRVRRAHRRLDKLRRALELASTADEAPIDVAKAAELTLISARALQRAAREGRLPARLIKRHNTRFYAFHPQHLAAYALSRVAA
jgi:hypothetical protein